MERNGADLQYSTGSDFFLSPGEGWRVRRLLAEAEIWPWMGEGVLLPTSLGLLGGATTLIS